MGKARAQILTKQLENNGGKVEKTLSNETTHILVGKTTRLSRIPNLLKIKSVPENVLVLRADWLSACLVDTEKVEHDAYVVHPEPTPSTSPSKDKITPKTSPSVSTPPRQKPSQSQTLKPSTDRHSGTEEETEGESKQPSTPTRPAVSLTSPKVTIYIYYVTV